MSYIQRVQQLHGDGCFVACVAMLLNIDYQNSYHLIFPDRNYNFDSSELLPDQAEKRLSELGFCVRPVRIRDTNFLRKVSLLMLRWEVKPTRGHVAIYQPENKTFLDPFYTHPLSKQEYENQLYRVLYLDVPK